MTRWKIAFVDVAVPSLGSVAWATKQAGAEVLYYTREKGISRVLAGMVERTSKLEDIVKFDPDAVVGCNASGECARLERTGLPVVCCSRAMTRLEDDREWAMSVATHYDLAVPDSQEFYKVDAAIKFLDGPAGSREWVFKSEGMASTTRICTNTKQLRDVVAFEGSKEGVKKFILQEHVRGVEISVEGWYDYRVGWIEPFNSTLERKRLFADDLGPLVGCMGSVVWTWRQESPKLVRQTLAKLTPYLKRSRWIGPLDVNCVIDFKTHRPWFLEFTPRIGSNAFEALMGGMYDEAGFFANLARGGLKHMEVTQDFMVAVRLLTPCVPDMPVYLPFVENPRLFPHDVWCDEKDVCRVVGLDGGDFSIVADAVGTGSTVEQAALNVYEDVISSVEIPDLAYRCDVGEKAVEDLKLLKEWGYGNEPEGPVPPR